MGVMPTLALLGDRNLDFLTHRELEAAVALLPEGVRAEWVASDAGAAVSAYDGVWVLPGTPYRDDDAVYAALRAARESGQPLLGTCGGFQYLVVEFARNVAGIAGAGHAEADPDAADAVAAPLACSLFGERRTVTAVAGTRIAQICGTAPFEGFHFCGYGLADAYVAALEDAGLVIGAHAPDAGVEAVELPAHPFYVATLFQPQVGASDGGPLHPLIEAFVSAAAGAPSAG